MSHAQICFGKATNGSKSGLIAGHTNDQAFSHSASRVPAALEHCLCLPSNVTINPISHATVSSFRRIIGLLLPIRYPDKFFAESIANATSSSLARAAIWHRTRPAGRKRDDPSATVPSESKDAAPAPNSSAVPTNVQQEDALGTVIGGIQCRIEQLPYHPAFSISLHTPDSPTGPKSYCYIQTLAILSPYRSKGIATGLLDVIITILCREECYAGTASIYAHVWEENEEALEWYVRRGFQVSKEVLKGYYRRLKPDGARVVWRDLGVKDHLRTQSRDPYDLINGMNTGLDER
ncbi:MAG: hypothetical protein Q9209_004917 [Squamulea sp. 1 TL-2023]